MLIRAPRLRRLALMVALLLLATLLRFAAWLDAPPGMRYDEMTVVYEADEIRAGARPIYMDGSAEEPLYHYLFAIAQNTIGPHFFTQKWLSAALGLLAIAAIYALGRRMFSSRIGLLAAAIATPAFWSLMYSRLGLRIIALPALVLLALIFLWHGLSADLQDLRRPRRSLYFVMAGILFGLTAYTYSATRMLPFILIAFLGYLLAIHRTQFKQQAVNIGLALSIGILIALPMAIHIATVPVAERRLSEVEGPLDALRRGDMVPLINSALITSGMFIARGDPEWLYNIPDRPVFDLVTGVIFYLAGLVCVRRFQHSAYAFVVIWLFFGLAPAVLTWPAASNSHGILAQSPTILIAAIGLDAITARFQARGLWIIGCVLLIHSVTSINDYFNLWATHQSVRREHAASLTDTVRDLQHHPIDTPLVFSSGDVTHWNPWSVTAFRMIAPLGYHNARWFDARSSFVFPQGRTDLTLINVAYDDAPAPLDARLIEDLFPQVESSPLSTDSFTATHLESSLNTRLITLTRAAVAWPPDAAINQPGQLPIVFDDRMALIGYEIRKLVVQPGRNIRLTTYWRAQNFGLEPTSIFVHVLDAQGQIAAQWDGYGFSPYYLEPGDIIAQVHFIPIRPDFEEGVYQLQLGVYLPRAPHQPRVPIYFMGQPVTDRILLQSIEVKK
jgi:hypothetical protein